MTKTKGSHRQASSSADLSREAIFHRALGDEARLRMILALSEGPLHVGALSERGGCSSSSTSQHLLRLLGWRLVARERDPKLKQRQLYSIAPEWAPLVAQVAERVAA